MPNRQKGKQSSRGDKRVTIDAKHNEQLKYFRNLKKKVPEMETQIKHYSDMVDQLEEKLAKVNPTGNDYIKISNQKMEYEDKIQSLEQDIVNIMDEKMEKDYYLSAGPYVMAYFVNKTNIRNGNIVVSEAPKDTKRKPYDKHILDFFAAEKEDDKVDTEGESFFCNGSNTSNTSNKDEENSDSDEVATPGRNQKLHDMPLDKINDRYMGVIDKNYISKNIVEDYDVDYCYPCQMEMKIHQSDGRMVCPSCGIAQRILVESDRQSCKDPPKEVICMGYRRINHFRECVAQVQAKETTDIPDELYDQIIFELKKERFHNMANLTPDKLKEILRKIKKPKYYEHAAHIINQLNGLPPPTYSKDLQIILDRMFNDIQIPFQKYRPKTRKNFLSYSYVLYKFFELLDMKEHCKNFNLLKSREKLYAQDLIWKKITKALNWRFIKSI